jgi:lipoprotein-releasing system permease protein
MAVLVIQAITWLVLVFFSTTEGIEQRWSQKIIGLVGPMRVIPTAAYFDSPWYQLDFYCTRSGFAPKRLNEKVHETTPNYDPASDPPLPKSLQTWFENHQHAPHPIAHITEWLTSHSIPWRSFETTVCHLEFPSMASSPDRSLSQYTCLFGVDSANLQSLSGVMEVTPIEAERFLHLLRQPALRSHPAMKAFVSSLGQMTIMISKDMPELHLHQADRRTVQLEYDNGIPSLHSRDAEPPVCIPLENLSFSVLQVAVHHTPIALPSQGNLSHIPSLGYPVLLPKQMRGQGVRLFDSGSFQFTGAGSTTLSIPCFVAGFFDSGILPIGGKLVVASKSAVTAIQPDLVPEGPMATSGIVVDVLSDALLNELNAIEPGLMTAQRYDQYETTTELYQQLASEKTLFRLLSIIIIAVACSNIFSMLFILAHDRRHEIAVLRALGSSKSSITAIFVTAGLGVGLCGSLLGSALAAITLHFLPQLLHIIGAFQGHSLLNQGIYGAIFPQTLSLTTLGFTLTTICCTSALAGAMAAIRACNMNVSEALKS